MKTDSGVIGGVGNVGDDEVEGRRDWRICEFERI